MSARTATSWSIAPVAAAVAGGRGGGGGAAGAGAVPRRCRSRPAAGRAGPTERHAAHVPRPRRSSNRSSMRAGGNQRDYLYVPNMHGTDWPKMKEMYGAAAAVRQASRRSELPARHHGRRDRVGHSYVRGGDMPDVPQSPRRTARRRLRDRERALQDHADLRQRELESGSALAARGAGRRRRMSATTSSRSTASS